jgi:predicted Zn-dependent peptidase
VAGEILEAWVSGNGLGDLENTAAEFRAVTAEQVLRVAERHLRPEQRAEGIVRGTGLSSPVAG